jgi:hypothetical protein
MKHVNIVYPGALRRFANAGNGQWSNGCGQNYELTMRNKYTAIQALMQVIVLVTMDYTILD